MLFWTAAIVAVVCVVALIAVSWRLRMPGKTHKGDLPVLAPDQKRLSSDLQHDLEHLAGQIGERNVSNFPAQLEESAQWIERELTNSGIWPTAQHYEVQGVKVRNIVAEFPGQALPEQIVIVGAHYDSVVGCPGANDNGSGTVALLALARRFAKAAAAQSSATKTLRLVFFVNEEPPWAMHDEMGSLVYARACKAKNESIIAMLSLETIGYYSDVPNSQKYPIAALKAAFPSTGNFIGFVGTSPSRPLVERAVETFRKNCRFPSEAAALPGMVAGVTWSDHWSFAIHGYQAIMVTDTAPFRYPHYHLPEDTPDKVDYDRMARVVEGLSAVVSELVQ